MNHIKFVHTNAEVGNLILQKAVQEEPENYSLQSKAENLEQIRVITEDVKLTIRSQSLEILYN